jgi:hypothetical protein
MDCAAEWRRVSTNYLQLEFALPAFRAWPGAPELNGSVFFAEVGSFDKRP